MRISVRKDDPGYRPWAVRCSVLLDGERVGDCHTADEELGAVWVSCRDGYGRLMLNFMRNKVVAGVLRGKVEIIGYWEAVSLYNAAQMRMAGVGRIR